MVNKVTLVGRLGADPEVRHLENGATVAKLRMATYESYRDKNDEWQEQTEWHDIVVWRYLAERAEQSLRKGMLVYLEGKLTHRKWQDKDGNNRYTTEVVGSFLRIMSGREGTGGDRNSNYFPSEEPAREQPVAGPRPAQPKPAPTTPAPAVAAEDDLPF